MSVNPDGVKVIYEKMFAIDMNIPEDAQEKLAPVFIGV